MDKKIKMLFLNTEEQKVEEVEVNDNIDEIRKLLGCSVVTYEKREVEHIPYIMVALDDAPENAIISGTDIDLNIMLVGNILITKWDAKGDFESLTEADLRILTRNILNAPTKEHPEGLKLLICNYSYN